MMRVRGAANDLVLDCSLLRWFSFNDRRQDVMIAIDIQRSRARDLEDQVLDFLVQHCGGGQSSKSSKRRVGPTTSEGPVVKYMEDGGIDYITNCPGPGMPTIDVNR